MCIVKVTKNNSFQIVSVVVVGQVVEGEDDVAAEAGVDRRRLEVLVGPNKVEWKVANHSELSFCGENTIRINFINFIKSYKGYFTWKDTWKNMNNSSPKLSSNFDNSEIKSHLGFFQLQ